MNPGSLVVRGTLTAVLAAMLACAAQAQTIFTSNTTIAADNFAFDGQDIVVRGCTVTIDGAHAFNSLTVERAGPTQPGVVTHTAGSAPMGISGVVLMIAGDCFIQGPLGESVGSSIDVTGRGFAPETGPGAPASAAGTVGGGSHAGAGGSSSIGLPGGPCYGSVQQPATFGSGGARDIDCCGFRTAGAGGGAVRLSVGGTLTVDGAIAAGGTSAPIADSGGGAGGSVWISAGTLAGSGAISASGGAGIVTTSGGGGGGRIAAYFDHSTFAGVFVAVGGGGFQRGGAGTIWLKRNADPLADLLIDGLAQPPGATTEFTGEQVFAANLRIGSGAIVGPPVGVAGLHLVFDGSVTVDAGGALAADARGHAPESGPAPGTTSAGSGAGGAHAGAGGNAASGALGGHPYGSITQPVTMGSGGGRDLDCCGLRTAARGGGALRLTAAGDFINHGRCSVNGQSAPVSESGGGAAGSLWITAASLSGAGEFRADGGAGAGITGGGGGGGGRIALVYSSVNLLAGAISATGGAGSTRGGAGTVFVKDADDALGTITVSNGALPFGATTEFSGDVVLPASLVVGPGAIVGPPVGEAGLHLTVAGDAFVAPDARISASFRGHAPESGPAPGVTTAGSAPGGGHGGAGGNSSIAALGGGTYGSVTQPVTMGSGGGRDLDCCGLRQSGRGGGALRLSVAGTLTVDGEISAHGQAAPAADSGGGAAGSLWITAGQVAGGGEIVADGGAGTPTTGGGGGGGRIAVYFETNLFGGTLAARGGSGFITGGAGTVFTKRNADPIGTIRIENGGAAGATTEFTGDQSFDASLVVGPGALVGPPVGIDGLHLTFAGNVTVLDGGAISASDRGFPGEAGPGAGTTLGGSAGGAGHGGAGGDSSVGALGGDCYGDPFLPTSMGSGGGRDLDCCGLRPSGRGGGTLRLTVAGTLSIQFGGNIAANGQASPAADSAGGSGGSIWITTGSLTGGGAISADGGAGSGSAGGGGGGGRIAIYFGSNFLEGTITACGGSGAVRGGAGTVFLKPDSVRGTVHVNNCGNLGETTELFEDEVWDANLRVAGAGILGHKHQVAGTYLIVAGDATIDPDGFISASGRGFSFDAGPGAGSASGSAGAGGGHGGAGGSSISGAPGGMPYGSASAPTTLGSGGGRDLDCCGLRRAGAGGGALRLLVAGALIVDGELSADGFPAPSAESGGGSGGSLWITAGSLAGSGSVSADGGLGAGSIAGSGGGGRVAIYSCNVSLPIANITANPAGTGARAGQPGSIVFGSGTVTITAHPADADADSGTSPTLSVAATTTQDPPTLSYQWRRQAPEGEFVALVEGQDGRFFNVTTPTFTIAGALCTDSGIYDCLVADSCGAFPSDSARLTIFARPDFNRDGELTADDLSDYITCYFSIPPCDGADFSADGEINADDLSDYITAYFSGC